MLHSREHVLMRIVNRFLVRNVNNFGEQLQMQIEGIYKEGIEKWNYRNHEFNNPV